MLSESSSSLAFWPFFLARLACREVVYITGDTGDFFSGYLWFHVVVYACIYQSRSCCLPLPLFCHRLRIHEFLLSYWCCLLETSNVLIGNLSFLFFPMVHSTSRCSSILSFLSFQHLQWFSDPRSLFANPINGSTTEIFDCAAMLSGKLSRFSIISAIVNCSPVLPANCHTSPYSRLITVEFQSSAKIPMRPSDPFRLPEKRKTAAIACTLNHQSFEDAFITYLPEQKTSEDSLQSAGAPGATIQAAK